MGEKNNLDFYNDIDNSGVENNNTITEQDFEKLYKDYQKQGLKIGFKVWLIGLLFGTLLIGAVVLAFSFFETDMMLTIIALVSIPALLVVLTIVLVKISKPYRKLQKELKKTLKANPEIKKAFYKKHRKNYLIRVIVFIILLVLVWAFASSGSSSDPYDGYSSDYKYNEEYREAVDEFAKENGEDSQSVDRVFQNFGKHS